MSSQLKHPITTAARASAWVVFLWFSGTLIIDGLLKIFQFNWASSGWGDCRVDWGAARLFLEHKSPYSEEGLATMNLQQYGFGHPPTTSFWFIPFAKVGYPVMAEMVAIATLIALLFHLVICAYELRLPAKLGFVLLGFGAALQTTWMVDHLYIVQVSEIIAFLFVLAWYFLRRDREIEAGITLGAACTLKLFPGVLVLFLLLTRRFRGVVAASVTYIVVALFMTTGFGWRAWKDFFHQQGPMANYWIGHCRNASLNGIIVRLFRPLCERPADDAQVLDIIGELRKMPSLPPIPGARWGMIASVLLLAFCWWISRRDAFRTATVDVPYMLFGTVAVFVNPWIWEHYAAFLIAPVFILTSAALDRFNELKRLLRDALRPRRTVKRAFVELVVLSAGAIALATLLWTNGYLNRHLYDQYWANRNAFQIESPSLHLRMHLYEVLNWLPWVVAIASLSSLIFFDRRRFATQTAAGAMARIEPADLTSLLTERPDQSESKAQRLTTPQVD